MRFQTEEGAQACLERMNGRFFGGLQLTAALWDGVTNYNVKVRKYQGLRHGLGCTGNAI